MREQLLLCLLLCTGLVVGEQFFMMHVTDVHGWIAGHPHNATLNADFGDFASLVEHMNARADAEGFEFLLFDSGDLVEGTGISDATPIHGQYIFPIISQIQNYTALTMGNHDVGHASTVQLMNQEFVPQYNDGQPQSAGRYLTGNTEMKGKKGGFVGEPYSVYTTKEGSRLLLMGWMFNFTQESYITNVTFVSDALQQSWFQDAMAEPDIDMIISIMHIDPQSSPEMQQIYEAVRAVYPEIPYIMFSGHRHVLYFDWFDDYSFTIESGKYFEELGLVSFNLSDGAFENFEQSWMPTSVDNFVQLSGTTEETFLTPLGNKIKKQINYYTNVLNLNVTLGCSPMTYNPYLPVFNATSLYNLYIEEMVPQMVFSTALNHTQYFVTNSATLRYDLFAGRVDVNDIFAVNPFSDEYVYFNGLTGDQVRAIVQYSNSATVPSPRAVAISLELPPYMHSLMRLNDSEVYDIVCSAYDAYSVASWIEALYPTADNSYETYPTPLESTGVIGGYVMQFMPCSASCPC